MFDIISWIRETIFRRPSLTKNTAWEELSEKQTTKMGYFLLVCMFFAIISTAQWTILVIKDIPDKPLQVPNCVTAVLNAFDINNTSYNIYQRYSPNYSSYGWYNDCTLISSKPTFDLFREYETLRSPYEQLQSYSNNLSRLQSEKSNSQYRQNNSREDYNTALNEKMAQEWVGIYNGQQIQEDITTSRDQIVSIDTQITLLQKNIENLRAQYAWEVATLKAKQIDAEWAYKKTYLAYEMTIAILSLIFSGSVFIIFYRLYVRRKIENSPHTIIFSVATFAYGLVLLQILFLFLWKIIPHTFLEWLLGWISVFTPLLYLVQFLWPVIIVAIFGYLVYRIQKRLYSSQNVLKRFVMDKKCPSCGNAVDMLKPFCPLCAHEIHAHCGECHELTMKWMPYCSNCGATLPKENEIYRSNMHTLHVELSNELDKIPLEGISGVKFTSLDGASFTSKRETVIRLTIYVTNKLQKASFDPGEFTPYFDKIIAQINQKNISQSELDRVLWKIRSWNKSWWHVEFIHK